MAELPVRIAVVLAGAVAKGAFEAGVLHTLVRANVRIVRIVAASSGALNGTMLAASVRARELEAGTAKLVELWRDHAGWTDVFRPRLRLLRTVQGISDNTKVLALLRAQIPPIPVGDEIHLRLLTAPLGGITGTIGDHPATTFEAVRDFTGADFATAEALEPVFAAATASSAFPLVFAPVTLDGLGPCVDGGAVNNTPIARALDGPLGTEIDTIVVIATSVELRTGPPPEVHGLSLASHLGSMLIGERLYRDLRATEAANASLARLTALVAAGVLDRAQLDHVLAALDWTGRRPVQIIQIRPVEELAGSSFSGFFEPALRAEHITAGVERAREVLANVKLPAR
ncbi:MAG: patatin-like phospholipase family protein [Kofleriaceae bacterium]